ncbi:MAG TPA: beta/gamma crystallin-related protein [Casimicrobiaceae bacterium]|nr:beta/gamma crystallin-related protein [Casimicrobiaceae bacterium]
MKAQFRAVAAVGALACAAQASAQVTFFEDDHFQGRSITVDHELSSFDSSGFNDRASSVIVRGGVWQMCENARFAGRCVTLQPGSYPSLGAMGLNDKLSSARLVDARYGAAPPPQYYASDNAQWRRHAGERLWQAPVTSVRAVVGPPEQRCWVEQQTTATPTNAVPGAIAGAVLGGILGHQIGSGRGRDVATGLGAVAGGAVGANVGGHYGGYPVTQDVQRCETASSGRVDYYDVAYNFRGYEHHVQLTSLPGPTITVNETGEPRV